MSALRYAPGMSTTAMSRPYSASIVAVSMTASVETIGDVASFCSIFPVVLSRPLLHIPLLIRLVFLLGTLAGQATRDSVFLLDSLSLLVRIRLFCGAVLFLQLPRFRLFS